MIMNFNTGKGVYFRGTKTKKIYLGSTLVWQEVTQRPGTLVYSSLESNNPNNYTLTPGRGNEILEGKNGAHVFLPDILKSEGKYRFEFYNGINMAKFYISTKDSTGNFGNSQKIQTYSDGIMGCILELSAPAIKAYYRNEGTDNITFSHFKVYKL